MPPKKVKKKAKKKTVKKKATKTKKSPDTQLKSLYKSKKEEYEEKITSISDTDLRKLVSMLALKDVINEKILEILFRKGIISQKEFTEELVTELKKI